jgi:hypothetical protein
VCLVSSSPGPQTDAAAAPAVDAPAAPPPEAPAAEPASEPATAPRTEESAEPPADVAARAAARQRCIALLEAGRRDDARQCMRAIDHGGRDALALELADLMGR